MTPTHPRTATYQRELGGTPQKPLKARTRATTATLTLTLPQAREAPRDRLQPVNLTPIREAA